MEREEIIGKAAEEFAEAYKHGEAASSGFYHGAIWADEHPKSPWRLIANEMPPAKQRVLFLDTTGKPHLGYSNIDCKSATIGADSPNDEVTLRYWMPIPELPKKEVPNG